MKELICYLYNINIYNKTIFNNETIYVSDNTSYLYKEISNADTINSINKYLIPFNQNGFFSYKFKVNIYGEIISKYDDTMFVILDIGNNYSKITDYYDMINFYNKSFNFFINKINYKNNWDVLWENKIDYLNAHFCNNDISNRKIETIFYYYIAVAESALLYIKNIKGKHKEINAISFVHRRIDYPNLNLNFYNPLNFIIDLEIRDIAEYIKSLYYNNSEYVEDLKYYLKTHNINTYIASMLYARIIYPSVFFDDYEKNKIDLKKYIDFDQFKKFSKKIYDVITSYINIDKIDWLN